MPHLSAYFQSGGMVDAVLNLGLPAPIDVQVSGSNLEAAYRSRAASWPPRSGSCPASATSIIPQDLDYPSLQLDIDRARAGQLGLTSARWSSNVITALTSNQMIAPSYWVDPKSGNDYMLTVQYPENAGARTCWICATFRCAAGSAHGADAARCGDDASRRVESPTEVDHYQMRRVIDIYVSPAGEDLGRVADRDRRSLMAETKLPEGVRVDIRGMVQGMRASFRSFASA